MTTPSGRRRAVEHLTRRGISQRKACRYLGLSRRVTSYALKQPEKDQAMGDRLIAASQDVPRFGYRRMAAWLSLSESRVRRMWRTLGLNIPRRRPRRRRCGSDIRLPGSVRPNAVWSYDFVHDQLVDGKVLKLLCVVDEYTRECLAIEVGASLRSQDVILTLSRLMRLYGKPRVRAFGQWRRVHRCQGDALAARQRNRPGFHQRREVRGKTASSRASTASCATRKLLQPRMVPHSHRGQDSHRALAALLTTSSDRLAHIVTNHQLRFAGPGSNPLTSPRDSPPDWLQKTVSGQSHAWE